MVYHQISVTIVLAVSLAIKHWIEIQSMLFIVHIYTIDYNQGGFVRRAA